MQALILVGGEGTRLRPLTSRIPKPVVPLVERPFITYMLEWLRSHGVEEVILACGFLPDALQAILGDGSSLGLRLHYVVEPEPLGTGGALAYAAERLADRFLMLNGDVLTDMDLTAQLAAHEASGACGTLALINVEDPSAYGLVPLNPDGSVREFLEKPSPEEASETNLVNAGAYVLERSVLEVLPAAGTNCSIERDVFPKLVGHGLHGFAQDGYWMDIGTPSRYLQATYDILEGTVTTRIGERLARSAMRLVEGAEIHGRVVAPALVGAGSRIERGAIVGGRSVLGREVWIGPGAHVEGSVLLDGVRIGAHSRIRGAILAAGASVGDHCHLDGGVVLGEQVSLGAENTLAGGIRIFPGVQLPDGAIRC
jgi:mannose-1-phosphate guanylyltransferase